jgi:hypothetical protein
MIVHYIMVIPSDQVPKCLWQVTNCCASLIVEGKAFTYLQYESEDQRPKFFIIWSSTKALPALFSQITWSWDWKSRKQILSGKELTLNFSKLMGLYVLFLLWGNICQLGKLNLSQPLTCWFNHINYMGMKFSIAVKSNTQMFVTGSKFY